MKAYNYSMQPINGVHDWKKSLLELILPPPVYKMLGRPKKSRKKAKNEPRKKLGVLSREGQVNTCSLCGVPRHNKRSCPNRTSSCNVEGSFTKKDDKAKGKRGSSDSISKKNNKGKEKVPEGVTRPVRIRKPSIKGYSLFTNLKIGEQTFYYRGNKGIKIQEPNTEK
ncbi:hypothetical protein PTKIN_Ptkin19aG0029600 [Pterospermum kingtungense]